MAILPEHSGENPALANFDDRLFLAWTGTDDAHHLNIMSSADGITFENKQTLVETSIAGPALGVFGGVHDRFVLAWTGTDDAHHLNVRSSADGITFENKQTLAETSIDGPALAPFAAALFIAWTGTDEAHHLNGMPVRNGDFVDGKRTLNDPAHDSTSFANPALITEFEEMGSTAADLLLAWFGWDRHLNLLQTNDLSSENSSRDEFRLFSDTSIAGPALARLVVGDVLTSFVAWVGTNDDRNLNVKSVPDLTEI
jgi:hypothetical protein